MRQILATILILILTVVSAAAQTAEDKESQEKYKNVILLSQKIKEYEKREWGVEPGRFATQLPQGTAKSYVWFVAQDRLKLVHNYLESSYLVFKESFDFILSMSTPKVLGKIKNKDTFMRSTTASHLEEVSEDTVNEDLGQQILIILHEDFHNYNNHNLSNELRAIEESFGTAFMHFASFYVATDIFDDAELVNNLLYYADKREAYYRQLNSCYKDLETLYRSNLLNLEKLESREPILKRCGQNIGVVEFNNAFLADTATYFFYYFYAWEKLEQFGIERFLTAYLKTAVEQTIATKKRWGWLKYPIKKLSSGIGTLFRIDASRTKQEERELAWLKKFEANLKTA